MKIAYACTGNATTVPNTFKNLAPHIQSVSPAFTLIDKPEIDIVSIHIDESYKKALPLTIQALKY